MLPDTGPLRDALRPVIDPQTPRCPLGRVIQDGIGAAVAAVPGVQSVDVRLAWAEVP